MVGVLFTQAGLDEIDQYRKMKQSLEGGRKHRQILLGPLEIKVNAASR